MINLQGKEYPFWYSIKAQREFQENQDIEKMDDFETTLYLIFLGLKYGSIKEGKKFPFKSDQILDVFEDEPSQWNKANELLKKHMATLTGT